MKDEKILFEGDGDLGHYKVVEGRYLDRHARVLYGDSHSAQSGMALDDDPNLIFEYNQRFMEIIEDLLPRRILLIGVGVLTLPHAIVEKYPNVTIDVVEPDTLLPRLATQYFYFDSSRVTVHETDGRTYLNATNTKYDMVIVDAFRSHEVPKSLITVEAMKSYANHLSDDGCLLMNFIAAYHYRGAKLTEQIQAACEPVLPFIRYYQSVPELLLMTTQNLVLFASKIELPFLNVIESKGLAPRPTDPAKAISDQDILEV